ncbi:hypothetical protein BJ508DRAFT_413411 [Ascobolus immersus RN42]|uniref:Uncharacterized protein n=1 Tax=Ascobolus immersus RN42 TaxID=1160509 RepID=A0A3N4IBJ3_ASCIM|nr:hypothetical protein BJ508DRAFT_413411 [Ascobolus immersus RN42]
MSKLDSRDQSTVFPTPPPSPLSSSSTSKTPSSSRNPSHNAPVTSIFPNTALSPADAKAKAKADVASELYKGPAPNRRSRRRNEFRPFLRTSYKPKPSPMAMARSIEDHMMMLEREITQIPPEARKMYMDSLEGTVKSSKKGIDMTHSKKFAQDFRAKLKDAYGSVPDCFKEGSFFDGVCLNTVFVETITRCLKPENMEGPACQSSSNSHACCGGCRDEDDEEDRDDGSEFEDEDEEQDSISDTIEQPNQTFQKPAAKGKSGASRDDMQGLEGAFATKFGCSFFGPVERAMMEKAVTGFKRIAEEHIFNKTVERLKPPKEGQPKPSVNTQQAAEEEDSSVEYSTDEDGDGDEPGSPELPRQAPPTPGAQPRRSTSPQSDDSSVYSYPPRRRPPRTCRGHTWVPPPETESESASEKPNFWNIFVDVRLAFDENYNVINADTGKNLGTLRQFVIEACSPNPVPAAVMEKISDLELRLRNSKKQGHRRTDTGPRPDISLDKTTVKRSKRQDGSSPPAPPVPIDKGHSFHKSECTVEAIQNAEGTTYTYTFDGAIEIRTKHAPSLKRAGDGMEMLSIDDPAVPQSVRDAAIRVKNDIVNGGTGKFGRVRVRKGEVMAGVIVEETVVVEGYVEEMPKNKTVLEF